MNGRPGPYRRIIDNLSRRHQTKAKTLKTTARGSPRKQELVCLIGILSVEGGVQRIRITAPQGGLIGPPAEACPWPQPRRARVEGPQPLLFGVRDIITPLRSEELPWQSREWTSNAGTTGSIPGWGTKITHAHSVRSCPPPPPPKKKKVKVFLL